MLLPTKPSGHSAHGTLEWRTRWCGSSPHVFDGWAPVVRTFGPFVYAGALVSAIDGIAQRFGMIRFATASDPSNAARAPNSFRERVGILGTRGLQTPHISFMPHASATTLGLDMFGHF